MGKNGNIQIKYQMFLACQNSNMETYKCFCCVHLTWRFGYAHTPLGNNEIKRKKKKHFNFVWKVMWLKADLVFLPVFEQNKINPAKNNINITKISKLIKQILNTLFSIYLHIFMKLKKIWKAIHKMNIDPYGWPAYPFSRVELEFLS